MTKLEFNEENLSKEQIEQLENIVKESKKKKVWKPKYGDKVYWIYPFSEHGIDYCTFENNDSDLLAYNMGSIFETKAQAEFELEKRKVEFEIKQYAESHNNAIPLLCVEKTRYHIWLDANDKKIKVGFTWCLWNQGVIYFTNEEDCRNCIEQVGEERIKKYIFGVEE